MEPTLRDLALRVDAEVDRLLATESQRIVEVAGPDALALVSELKRVMAAGGHRFRPAFCYWGYRAAGGGERPALARAAAAIELLHTFALVHDDIMDRSPTRRGQASVHASMATMVDGGEAERFGISGAILVGDLALSLAYQLLEESGFRRRRLRAAAAWMHRMRTEAIAGQYLDLVSTHRRLIDEDLALRVAELKSGGYTIHKPLLVGAALAHPLEPEVPRVLSRYGKALGLAFQLRDDVLGVFGDAHAMGKDVHRDLTEGKRTFLVVRAFRLASPLQQRLLEQGLGRTDLTREQAEVLRDVIRSSGALTQTLERIDVLTQEAKQALDSHALPPTACAALKELADVVAARQS